MRATNPNPAAWGADRAPDSFESYQAPNGPEIPQTRESVQASRLDFGSILLGDVALRVLDRIGEARQVRS